MTIWTVSDQTGFFYIKLCFFINRLTKKSTKSDLRQNLFIEILPTTDAKDNRVFRGT